MHDQITDAEYQHDLRDLRRRQGTPEYADARRAEIAQRAWALLHDAGACLEYINEHDLSSGAEFEHAGHSYYILDSGMMMSLCDDPIEREAIRCAVYDRIYEILADDDGPIAKEVDEEWSQP